MKHCLSEHFLKKNQNQEAWQNHISSDASGPHKRVIQNQAWTLCKLLRCSCLSFRAYWQSLNNIDYWKTCRPFILSNRERVCCSSSLSCMSLHVLPMSAWVSPCTAASSHRPEMHFKMPIGVNMSVNGCLSVHVSWPVQEGKQIDVRLIYIAFMKGNVFFSLAIQKQSLCKATAGYLPHIESEMQMR